MFSKKGEISLITLMESILGILLAVLFFTAASAIGDNYDVQKFAVAKDVSLLIDVVQAIPFDLHYEYPETVSGNNILIEDSIVSIVPDNNGFITQDATIITQHKYSSSENYYIKKSLVDGGFFVLDKVGDKIIFSNESFELETTQSITKKSKELLILSIKIKSSDDKQDEAFLDDLKNKLKGNLNSHSFSFNGEPNLFIGLSSGEHNLIYHSDTQEALALSNYINQLFSKTFKKDLIITTGTNMFKENQFFIEIVLDEEMQKIIQSNSRLFVSIIGGSIDQFYE